MSIQSEFLDHLAEHPDDAITMLVFADWLEEHDGPLAELIRVHVSGDRKLENELRYKLGFPPIFEPCLNCFGHGCEMMWDDSMDEWEEFPCELCDGTGGDRHYLMDLLTGKAPRRDVTRSVILDPFK